jgi:hypothetical protein
MNVLVIVGSKHGSTREIATAISDQLTSLANRRQPSMPTARRSISGPTTRSLSVLPYTWPLDEERPALH